MKSLVSLDVFDTAIFRKVINPFDIFDLVEEKIGKNFKVRRIEAQNTARIQNTNYTLSDIYKYLPNFDMKDEIRAEYLNCEPNPYTLNMYNNFDADYIFISDMYLPSSLIKSMLEKCGYNNPQVFVSCEHKALKCNGALFKKVEEVLGRKIDKHIGDNYLIDILGAKKAKISEVEYTGPAIYDRNAQILDLKSQKLRKFLLDTKLNSNISIEEKIGYKFAPLVLFFTKKVLDECNDNQTIFFNARDGFLMYIVARWILKTDKRIKYCRFSRKSCHFPNINTNFRLDNSVNARALSFFKTLRIQTIKDFLNMFEFKKDYNKELATIGLNEDSPLDFSLDRNSSLVKFLLLIQDDLYEKAREDRVNFLKYIKNLGMKDKDIFVDLGHFGSMQSIIKKLACINLKGRYIHMFHADNYFKGVIEDKTSFLPKGSIALYTGIVELIFSEPKGTVISYNKEGKPVLNKDKKFRQDVTKRIVKGVLEGVKKLLDDDISLYYEDIVKVLNDFLENPSLEEAQFGNSKLFENGSCEDNESIVWFDEDYIRRGRIKDCYNRSYWKTAFKLLLRNSKYYKLENCLKK